jgi:hypothetical protein
MKTTEFEGGGGVPVRVTTDTLALAVDSYQQHQSFNRNYSLLAVNLEIA